MKTKSKKTLTLKKLEITKLTNLSLIMGGDDGVPKGTGSKGGGRSSCGTTGINCENIGSPGNGGGETAP